MRHEKRRRARLGALKQTGVGGGGDIRPLLLLIILSAVLIAETPFYGPHDFFRVLPRVFSGGCDICK